MSRNIKTVKCLMKHVGKTVHVVSFDGYKFDAEVCLKGPEHDQYICLYSDDETAKSDRYWWPSSGRYGHSCAIDYQITEELKSLTTIADKKASKKKTKYLTKAELDAARGHFCLLEDGSKGFICIKTGSASKLTRVLHNSADSCGWSYGKSEMSQDNAPKAIKGTFKYGYNAWDDSDAAKIKVVEVLEKYDGRKYRFKKAKEEPTKTMEAPKVKEDKKFLTASEIKAGIGHLCKLADGTTAFVAASMHGIPVICMHTRSQNIGWCLDCSDVSSKFAEDIKGYEYGWNVSDARDAQYIKVVSILDNTKPESPKTILDMTIKELLEKLDEIIKR